MAACALLFGAELAGMVEPGGGLCCNREKSLLEAGLWFRLKRRGWTAPTLPPDLPRNLPAAPMPFWASLALFATLMNSDVVIVLMIIYF
jgi:hypothetical protein